MCVKPVPIHFDPRTKHNLSISSNTVVCAISNFIFFVQMRREGRFYIKLSLLELPNSSSTSIVSRELASGPIIYSSIVSLWFWALYSVCLE